MVNQLTYAQTNWTVGDAIREGKLSTLLLRPLSPIFDAVSTEVAGKVVYLLFVVPVVTTLWLVLRPELHLAPTNTLLFLPALVFAWLLRFFWGYSLALLAFWATRADALLAVQDSLVFLLAGQVAPVALLPEPLQYIATVLPFRYMISFPVEIVTAQLTGGEIMAGFAWQLSWLAAAVGLFSLLWRRGVRRYAAVGG